MIDILQKLREYQEAGHNVGDAINNVERTNPEVQEEGAMKEIDTVKKEKARLHARLKDLKSKYNAQMANAYAGNPDDTMDKIEKIEKELGISQEAKDMKKESVNESITIATDSPQEASMMMQILKLAGVQPVDQAMINQPSEQEGCGCDDSCSCGGNCGDDCDCENCGKQEETYANEPDTKTQSVDDLVNVHSGGLNRQKQTFPKVASGDNPMQKATEDLANSLREQYKTFKENYAKAVDEAKAKSPYAIGMAQAMKSTGDTPPLEKSTIKKAHDIAKSIKKSQK